MDLLGDFGGFNDAIIFIVSTIFASYGASMYEASIASQINTASTKKLNHSHKAKIKNLEDKINAESQSLGR